MLMMVLSSCPQYLRKGDSHLRENSAAMMSFENYKLESTTMLWSVKIFSFLGGS